MAISHFVLGPLGRDFLPFVTWQLFDEVEDKRDRYDLIVSKNGAEFLLTHLQDEMSGDRNRLYTSAYRLGTLLEHGHEITAELNAVASRIAGHGYSAVALVRITIPFPDYMNGTPPDFSAATQVVHDFR